MQKEEAEAFYKSIGEIYCPYFKEKVVFTSDGFHHLQFSPNGERKREEQHLKFSLLRLVSDVIRNSGTVQEHRKTMAIVGRKKTRDGSQEMKVVEYWGLVAICGDNRNPIRIKVILRRIGTGNLTFWSVMPMQKFGRNSYAKLASSTIEAE